MQRILWTTLSLTLLITSPISAQGQMDERVAKAVQAGAKALKELKKGDNGLTLGQHGVGGDALACLALLEAGVANDDAVIQRIINKVREQALSLTKTYDVSLAILLLDRFAEPKDVPIIQMLGVRLYAGCNQNGGWTYTCWDEMNPLEVQRLQAALQERNLQGGEKPKPETPNQPLDPFANPQPKANPSQDSGQLHLEVARILKLVRQTLAARGRGGMGDDNSNTQFGMLGLWVASRHGVPSKDVFSLVRQRFLISQNRRDGGWSYSFNSGDGPGGGSSTSMTCAGLLGLAFGEASRTRELRAEQPEPKQGPAADPFSNPDQFGGKPTQEPEKPKKTAAAERASQVALAVIGQVLNAAGQGQGGVGNLGNFIGIGNAYYMLWSLERMSVAYNLDTIGNVDWYRWGSTMLLASQQQDGSWEGTEYGADINTSFALLFLTKSNFAKDLTGVGGKDPGISELRGGGAATPLFAPPPQEEPGKPKKNGSGGSNDSGTIGFTLPEVIQPTVETEARKWTQKLIQAKPDEWKAILSEVETSPGAKFTRAMVFGCNDLASERRAECREALANRLTRMTPKTLREMLVDTEPELRRAAALAIGMTDQIGLIPELIDRVADPSDLVVRAVRASLKVLAKVDFGPQTGADEDAKLEAARAWGAWLDSQRK